MTIKAHILRTASEIAMGRYMRAPDHPPADEFASTFDNLAAEDARADDAKAKGGEPPPADEPPADDKAKAGEPPAGDPPADEPPADDKAKGGEPPPADEPPADDKAKADEPPVDDKAKAKGKEPATDDFDADKVLKRLSERLKDADEPVDKKKVDEPPADEPPPLYNDDEQKILEKHKSDWGDVMQAEQLIRRGEYRSLLAHTFSEIEKQLAPLRDMVEALATRTHVADLKGSIGDYTDDEREQVIEWVKTQPTYLQNGMMTVIEEGTAAEVADLVSRYREATGKKPAGEQVPATEPPGGDVELSNEAKQAAEALAPVDSKRSVVRQPDDKSNYDDAFLKWADAEKL